LEAARGLLAVNVAGRWRELAMNLGVLPTGKIR
jgi:hypothetical protein